MSNDVQWDISDFPLLVAQHDHLARVKKAVSSILNEPLALSDAELADHHSCRFGEWYYGLGKRRYGHLPEFLALEVVHADVHKVGQEIVRLHEAGDDGAAQQLSEQLLVLKDQVLSLLADLQHQVASNMV